MKKPKFAKGLIAGALIFGVSAGGATVWASTNGAVTVTSVPTNTTSTATSGTTNDTANAATGTTNSSTSANTSTTSTSPQLSGDYSNFVKTIYQQIEAALQAKDVAKAQQLAQFAKEQISKVNSLVQQGQTQAAGETLQTALASVTGTQSGSDSGAASDTSTAPTTTSSSSAAGTTGGATATTTGTTPTATTTDTQKATGALAKLPHNTLALADALQHVHNLQAQQSLEKNISKELAQLAAQLQKLASLQQQEVANSTKPQSQTQVSSSDSATPTATSGSGQASVKATEPSTSSTAKQHCSVDQVKVETEKKAAQSVKAAQSTKAMKAVKSVKSVKQVQADALHVVRSVAHVQAHKGTQEHGYAEHGDNHGK
ncbi:DUF5667 domain-containing protein [Alicyclobacillus fastidiosus]|uniref:DUF5667 domain-containing protein n=1 Tax=Alicyclobacillus fastidiosus TaxID=392011 RepID=A0ABV5AFA3_9BACL|nr:DUF5667 domain-containing protein [Alicyclobacillus fastidiosus]WEH12169.1 DUF5667 domain-containing protein [Alicyclobacillus fastidiosus]